MNEYLLLVGGIKRDIKTGMKKVTRGRTISVVENFITHDFDDNRIGSLAGVASAL